MKLFIQIPCLNEEKTLPSVIADLPRKIEGIEEIYTLVIDDSSTDKTVEVARRLGVDYIVSNSYTLGLARSFSKGLEASLFLGADIIVNTDGDNQYRGADIAKLVKPILKRKAEVVLGCRDIDANKEFSWFKKALQRLGSNVVRRLSGTDIPDTTSGFRAISRTAAIRFFTMSSFSYTLEMLIQAGRIGLKIDWIRIGVNPRLRESRLFKSTFQFVGQQLKTLLKVYLFYRPMRFFGYLASASFLISVLMALRILYFLLLADPAQHKFKAGSGMLLLFSSIITVLFITAGLLVAIFAGLRFLTTDIRSRIKNIELQQKIVPLDLHIITAPEPFRWARIKDVGRIDDQVETSKIEL